MLAVWFRNNAPVCAARIVIAGTAGVAAIGGAIRGTPAGCPNADELASIADIHTRNRTVCLEFITKPKLTGRCSGPASIHRFLF
jgi:hypothetical protein